MSTSSPVVPEAELFILANQPLGDIGGRLFGQFIELAGRCVNGGIYDPGSPRAREDGVRLDVLEAMKELAPTHIRYPGGCATSYFDWQELVGPPSQRPRGKVFEYLRVPQSCGFGIDECYRYCQEVGAEMYLTVNAHTQSPEDAAHLVEYLNLDTPTRWADLRRAHGREEPYGIKLFGLGNEIYGDWQAGHKTVEEYIRWCSEASRRMKWLDPSIETVCVGFGRPGPEWDRRVIKALLTQMDMISVHNYCGRPVFRDCMAAYRVYEEMFNWLNVFIDEAMDGHLGRKQRPGLAFDEWNVWYRSIHDPKADVEEIFDYADALTLSTIFHVMLRNTRSVRLSNTSLAVNTVGALFTDRNRMVRQTIFYPQKLYRHHHSGTVVQTVVDAPVFAAKHERFFCGIVDPVKAADENLPTLLKFNDIPALDALTSIDRGKGRLSLSVVQKLEDRPLTTRLSFRGIQPKSDRVTIHRLTGPSIHACNTLDNPNVVGLSTQTGSVRDTFTFPPASLTLIEFEI